jgi:hypothetical protein
MKTKNNLYLALIAFLISGLSTSANAAFIGDTIPETKISQDTLQTDEFSDLENELDAMKKTKDTDTTKIRIGKMRIAIMDDGKDVEINKNDWDTDDDNEQDWGWDDDEFDFHHKKKKDRFDPHWTGFGIGWNNFMTADQSLTLPEDMRYMDLNTNTSLEIALNFTELGINLVKNHVGLVTGMGIRWNNYKFSNTSVRLNKGASELEHFYDSTVNTTKSKLTVSYLTIPLMLEFQIPVNNQPLYLAAGIEGAIKLGAHTKYKTDSGNKSKTRSDYYINPFTYVASARIGYNDFGLYGTYSLQSLFKENEGPELYPFTIGISLNF